MPSRKRGCSSPREPPRTSACKCRGVATASSASRGWTTVLGSAQVEWSSPQEGVFARDYVHPRRDESGNLVFERTLPPGRYALQLTSFRYGAEVEFTATPGRNEVSLPMRELTPDELIKRWR